MNTSESLTRAVLIFIKISISSLLLFQVSSCDLEVIPPLESIKSSFTFAIEDPKCAANCLVTFTNASERATSYEWDFGDETAVSTVKDPQHTYVAAGTYAVVLKAKGDNVEDDTTIAVTVGVTSLKIKAKFTFAAQQANCTSNCVINFTNTSQNAATYEWNFGDASTNSTVKDPQHTYLTTGSYQVNLKATKGMESHDTTMTVTVGPPNTLTAFKHTVNTTNMDAQRTRMDYPNLNNNQSKIMVVSSVLGIRNTSAIGLYYFSNKWHIFNQNIASMKENEIYNVVVAEPTDPNAFVHQTSMANIVSGLPHISMLNHSSLNGKPNARVFVTPIWEQSTDFNNHPIGVVYLNDRWHVMNLDEAALPIGLKFNVIVSTADASSFVHTATAASISSDFTVIDNAITNAKPNAKIIFTYNQGTNTVPIYNPRVGGLWYSSGRSKWTIFNEGVEAMQGNPSFNVMVVE